VLHDDEGHAIVCGKRVEELPAGVKAASRGADRDDWKITTVARRERTLKPTPPLRHSLMRTTTTHSVIFLEERRSM
jgi:hypothetical protein